MIIKLIIPRSSSITINILNQLFLVKIDDIDDVQLYVYINLYIKKMGASVSANTDKRSSLDQAIGLIYRNSFQ